MRSRIILACGEGLDNKSVAGRVGCSTNTVSKWRARFVQDRLDGLVDEPRPGRPPVVGMDRVEDVVVATLESTPANATHWSRAKMAKRTGLSKSTIGRIWKAFELKPHLEDGFKLSNDPQFVEKVFDFVGLYLNPPEAAVVYCVDEKSQVQALARSQPAFPMMPGMPEKRTHDYVRHGTATLFAALEIATAANPKDTNWGIQQAYALSEAERFTPALEVLDRHVAGNQPWLLAAGSRQPYPNWKRYDAEINRALMLSYAEDLPGAQAALEPMLGIAPHNSGLHAALGMLYARRGWTGRGLRHQRIAATLDPDNVSALIGQSESLMQLQRAGGKRLAAADFLRGFELPAGALLTLPDTATE